MNAVADRFIELSIAEKYRRLTKVERYEKQECLKYLDNRQWKLAKLGNFLHMASMTGDKSWEHRVSTEIVKTQMGVKEL